MKFLAIASAVFQISNFHRSLTLFKDGKTNKPAYQSMNGRKLRKNKK